MKDILNQITFKAQTYGQNYDFIQVDENIISEHNGVVSLRRMNENKKPIAIGEYTLSVWNIELAKVLKTNVKKLLRRLTLEDSYNELNHLVRIGKFDIESYERVVIVHGFIIHENFRKLEITEEFIEHLYRRYYSKNTAILILAEPIQDNEIDIDYFENHKTFPIQSLSDPDKIIEVSGSEYYALDKFKELKDREKNEYKLFAIAKKCGFSRIDDSHLFILNPDIIINRMLKKKRYEN